MIESFHFCWGVFTTIKLENTYIKIKQKYSIMKFITKPGTIMKIQILQGSDAKNYFETKERLFLGTILTKLQKNPYEKIDLTEKETFMLENIFRKYEKYL